MFTEENLKQITAHGLSKAEVERQLDVFKTGIAFVNIIEPASKNRGIEILSKDIQKKFVELFEKQAEKLDLLKFVPASGAASRMFKFLHEFLENYDYNNNDIEEFLEKPENQQLKLFFDSLDNFPFTGLVRENLKKKYSDFEEFGKGKKDYYFVQNMLGEEGLNYSNTPKGLIPFHKNKSNYITPFGAQLYEAVFYATSNKTANLHFTVAEEHKKKFETRYQEIINEIENRTQHKFDVSYSFQKKQTDTIAVTMDNQPFLDDAGDLVFRPSGHGALLENLNELDADLIFIKNIDNVVSEKHVAEIAFNKKLLAGKLLSLQKKIFEFVEALHHSDFSESLKEEISSFIREELQIKISNTDKQTFLRILERPIRVCGVVENTGAAGGGPFIVEDAEGNLSFQIVEMSQIDIENPDYKALVEKATHFNPVDLVCGVRNYKGEKYNLKEFADPKLAFISIKSYQGKKLKALELPGLWNGSMANWNTVFVEVPLITFNPVKTVNDLLNEVHQTTL